MQRVSSTDANLGPLQNLIGTWTNQDIGAMGGPSSPYSYNVMPLPEQGGNVGPVFPLPDGRGYILKNFTYTETITFNGDGAVTAPAKAPNRGGTYEQDPYALFYDQQVKFAEGPDGPANASGAQVVHEENGAWLHLISAQQATGPYVLPTPPPVQYESGPVIPQSADMTLAKMMSVPHGNSILALGSSDTNAPSIPVASILPTLYPGGGAPAEGFTHPYTVTIDTSPPQSPGYQNPDPTLTQNPNNPLNSALAAIAPTQSIHLKVSTQPDAGGVTNIPFEVKAAEVTSYHADYWILDNGGGYNYLLYTQTINMKITIGGVAYNFPHITCNALTRS